MNHVTAETVHQYAIENQLSRMDAKALLEKRTTTVLQYCPDGGTNQDWTNVPHVTEYRETE
jgi:hypothetical protein